MNPYYEGELQISLRLPGQTFEFRSALKLDPNEFRAFNPLPIAREIFFDEAIEGRKQEESRRRLAACIARAVTAHIMKTIEDGDTVNGYTKEEIRKFHTP